MPSYMLLLYDGPPNLDFSPDEMQKIIEKYSAWRDGLVRSGKLLSSDKLVDGEGRVVRRDNGRVRVKAPQAGIAHRSPPSPPGARPRRSLQRDQRGHRRLLRH